MNNISCSSVLTHCANARRLAPNQRSLIRPLLSYGSHEDKAELSSLHHAASPKRQAPSVANTRSWEETMRKVGRLAFAAAIASGSLGMAALATSARSDDGRDEARAYGHVLLISVDGMHAVDLANYINAHPQSHLAGLAAHGVIYQNALSSAPSDSFPGLLALVTGGTPKSTGVFYDNSYDRTLFAPGSNCQGPAGTPAVFDETIDNNPALVTGGGTLGKPLTQINPTALPLQLVDGKCVPVYPHDFVKVNT